MTECVRLYGHGVGEGSFAQVTRGMKRALAHHGQLAGFVPCDQRDEHASYGGAMAPVSLHVGNQDSLVQARRLGKHKKHWLLYAPNGETLPRWFVEQLTAPSGFGPGGLVDGFLAPSEWAKTVLSRHFPSKPIIIAPHGVTPEVHHGDEADDAQMAQLQALGEVRVLHMTSTGNSRKGTMQLIWAWASLQKRGALPALARLCIVADPLNFAEVRWVIDDHRAWDTINLVLGLGQSQEEVARLYRSVHLVCQPSRAEGFGLVPLEALACGTPIVATRCTGHSEYLHAQRKGAVIVKHGATSEMSEDFEGAMAPSVTAKAIERALQQAIESWPELKQAAVEAAPRLREWWSWEARNGPTIKAITEEEST